MAVLQSGKKGRQGKLHSMLETLSRPRRRRVAYGCRRAWLRHRRTSCGTRTAREWLSYNTRVQQHWYDSMSAWLVVRLSPAFFMPSFFSRDKLDKLLVSSIPVPVVALWCYY